MQLVHTSIAVGDEAVTVIPAAGENYQFIAISNNGDKAAFLKMVPSAEALTALNGVKLASGSVMLVDQDVTPILVTGVSAICASGDSTTLAVQAY